VSSAEEVVWRYPRRRASVVGIAAVFGVVGGPGAWFLQLCIGDWLANGPCFSGSQRYLVPSHGLAWTWPALVVLLLACVMIALAAFLTSLRIYRTTPSGATVTTTVVPSVNLARVRFMAYWGMIFGAGFCVATLLTAVAFVILPRCAG
jgi:hypothetical protein